MKKIMILIRMYFGILSKISPVVASGQAFKLFQRPRRIPFKEKEKKFYEPANSLTLESSIGPVHCYHKGDPKNETILLVHGWESNAGSMSDIGDRLVEQEYFVVSFDLPAHGLSKRKYINLLIARIAMMAVITHFASEQRISIISHSFGSIITAFAISQENIPLKNLIYLTIPDKVLSIFYDFKKLINLGDTAHEELIKKVEILLKAPLETINAVDMTRSIDFKKLLIIHDRYDKILPFEYSLNIHEQIPNSELIEMEKIGHYRMLWNEDVISILGNQLNSLREN